MAFAVSIALGKLLLLEVVCHHLCTRCWCGIGNTINIHVHDIVATHLCSHCKITDDDVLLLLNIVIIIVSVGVIPFAIVVVFLVVVALSVPIGGLACLIVHHSITHFIGGKSIVGRAEIEAQLIHGTGLHFDIVGKHNWESLPLIGIRVVNGQSHFLFETASLANTISFIQFVVLQKRQNIIVEDTDNPKRHRIEADGVEINRGFVHIGDDDTIVGPTHFRQIIGKVKVEGEIALQHHAVGSTDTTSSSHNQFRQLIVVERSLVEVEIDLVTFDISLVTKCFVEGDEAIQVLILFQRLRKKQGSAAACLVNVEHHGLEAVFGIHRQFTLHLSLVVDRLTIEDNGHLVIGILAFQALNKKIKDVIANVAHLNGMLFTESFIEQFDGIALVDRRSESQTDVVVHLFVGSAYGLHSD